MNNALQVMWISFFWFLMPGVSVTSRSSRSPRCGEGQAKGHAGPGERSEPRRHPTGASGHPGRSRPVGAKDPPCDPPARPAATDMTLASQSASDQFRQG